jgi:hypothetical protein
LSGNVAKVNFLLSERNIIQVVKNLACLLACTFIYRRTSTSFAEFLWCFLKKKTFMETYEKQVGHILIQVQFQISLSRGSPANHFESRFTAILI